ncbi:MAG: TIGR03987 family protein [Mogibacterium sp.]|nr:TIGR03987 family protein [Mogibacterium sp.]
MSPVLMRAVIAITLALVCYTIGVWWEHKDKVLRPIHLAFFWLGLILDATGTHAMTLLAGDVASGLTGVHGITGLIAIVLMFVHAVWATIVLVRKDENSMHTFHRFSITVWAIWLVPFIIGMFMGMH